MMVQKLALRDRRLFCYASNLPLSCSHRTRATIKDDDLPIFFSARDRRDFSGSAVGVASWKSHVSRIYRDKPVKNLRRLLTGEQSTNDKNGGNAYSSSMMQVRGGVDTEKKESVETNKGGAFKFIKRQLRKGAGGVLLAMGFVSSATTSLLTDSNPWKPSVDAIRDFLKTSGIDSELNDCLNSRVFNNLIILARIQRIILAGKDRRSLAELKAGAKRVPSDEEALRYMRYSTAAYGESIIQAAELEVRDFDMGSRRSTSMRRASIAEHVGVPEEDVAIMNVDYGGDTTTLRHFVAVDHRNEKVVLAIRGTFSLSEIIKDVAGFSRPFCGGEAHSEVANMAERVWETAGETVLQLLDENKNYELVITGHSLGAGTACLLNILCHRNNRELVRGHPVRCYAYSSPPVFTPLEFAPNAVNSCTHFIHQFDTVPFLSVDSVRRLLAGLRAVDRKRMGWWTRMRIAAGRMIPPPVLVEAVEKASFKIKPKEGAPLLKIPAASTLWMHERLETGTFEGRLCDPVKLASLESTLIQTCGKIIFRLDVSMLSTAVSEMQHRYRTEITTC